MTALRARLLKLIGGRRRTAAENPDRLFDGVDAAFKAAVAGASVYGEYGMGQSTLWVLRNTRARVLAVDTMADWVDRVRAEAGGSERLAARHVDLGPTRRFGRPVGYAERARFPEYTDWIWRQETRPDVVLIDGRFRVAAFLTSLLNAAPGTRLIFDDYVDRSAYQICEEFLHPSALHGRQAHFTVPEAVDAAALSGELDRFRYVMD